MGLSAVGGEKDDFQDVDTYIGMSLDQGSGCWSPMKLQAGLPPTGSDFNCSLRPLGLDWVFRLPCFDG